MTLDQDYYGNYGGLSVADYVERHVRGVASEMARIRSTVALVPAGVASLLDVGAGHGVLLEELQAQRGIAGVGIEITPAKVDYARSRGVDLRMGNAASLDFADRAFDAVVSCEVLEHLPYGVYEAARAELGRVARQWVIVTVPFDERRRFVRCPYCAARVNPDYHFRSFAPGALAGLVPGFVLERTLQLGMQRRSWLVDIGRRWIDSWPRFLICPCCGWRADGGAATAAAVPASAPAGDSASRALLRRLAGWIPARGRPIWLVGVFRREGGNG